MAFSTTTVYNDPFVTDKAFIPQHLEPNGILNTTVYNDTFVTDKAFIK